jgi:hypothetical protein
MRFVQVDQPNKATCVAIIDEAWRHSQPPNLDPVVADAAPVAPPLAADMEVEMGRVSGSVRRNNSSRITVPEEM